MSNTIELLEAIGSDASLRHASADDLAKALADMHASIGLQKAAAASSSAPLEKELGYRGMKPVDSPVQTGREDDEDETPDLPDDIRS